MLSLPDISFNDFAKLHNQLSYLLTVIQMRLHSSYKVLKSAKNVTRCRDSRTANVWKQSRSHSIKLSQKVYAWAEFILVP